MTTPSSNQAAAFNGSRVEANNASCCDRGIEGEIAGGVGGEGITSATSRPATTLGSNSSGNDNGNVANHTNTGDNVNNLSNSHARDLTTNTTSHRVNDIGKRKKLKSRNASVPNTGYSKDHLDAWLETCLKDSSNTQLSSSSEFLDYNPNPTTNKIIFEKQQQQPQTTLQQHLQHQQHSNTQSMQQQQQQQQHVLPPNSQTTNQYQMHQNQNQRQHHHYHHQQQQQQQPQPLSMRNNHSTPSILSCGSQTPFNLGFQKSMPNFMKSSSSSSFNNRYSTLYPSTNQLYHQNDGAQDFASLPPLVNIVGGGSMDNEQNTADILDGGNNTNTNISRGFRFSDPCLLNPSDNDSKISGRNTPDRRNYASANDMDNNKFYAALMEQINILHETNTKICRNLHETKVDIEALKHAPHWGMRHRRDSLSGLSTHSQPMAFGGGFGTQSPALTYHSGAYTPGMMTDIVREVKEAARVREDALLSRVKGMVEERQWSLNEGSLRMMRDIEDLKSQIQHLRADRKESNKRLTHLEAENKYMRQMLASLFHNRHSAQDIIYENETFRPRHKHFAAPSRRSNSLNLNYGTIHHQPAQSSYSVEEQEENIFNTVETPTTAAALDIPSVKPIKPQIQADFRNSFSSCDGVSVGGIEDNGGGGDDVCCHDNIIDRNLAITLNGGSGCGSVGTLSPPKFALVSTPDVNDNDHKRTRLKKPKQEEPLKQKDASEDLPHVPLMTVSTEKDASERIIALEKLVKSLQVSIENSSFPLLPSSTSTHMSNGAGTTDCGGLNVGGVCLKSKLQETSSGSTTQQQQILQQSQSTPTSSTNYNFSHSSPRLRAAGPITDL